MTDTGCMVSILCTAYMHEDYIAQTLDSFLMQKTDFPFEILVSDDASTDRTAEIIRDYAERYPDIIRPYLMEKNFYSTGGDFYERYFYPDCRGKYIAYCEGDDYWTDDSKLQQQVDFLEAHPDYSGCVHNTVLRYCGDAPQADRLLLPYTEDCDIELSRMLQGASKSFHTSSLLARRVIGEIQDFYRIAFKSGFTDYAEFLWLRLNGKIRYINKPMSVYRINSNNASWSSGVDGQYGKLLRFIRGEIEMLRCFKSRVEGETLAAVEREILEKEFELLYIQGRDRQLRRPPYDVIFKAKPLRFRLVNFVKCLFPRLMAYYRRRRGYIE